MTESELRERLVSKIDDLEPGLIFLEKEKYLPNEFGTRAFVDLYAKDKNGHHVLIELKKSDSTSRETLHEVYKYVENVKKYLGCRDQEIRVIVASTEWRELLVPFSRFVEDTSIAVVGLNIKIGPTENALLVEKIEPLKTTEGRYLAPWHELNFYTDENSLKRGSEEYFIAMKEKGIEDFVIVVLEAPKGYHEKLVNQTRESLLSNQERFGEMRNLDEVNLIVSKMEEHKYILYFSLNILEKKKCLEIISRDKEFLAEVKDYLSDLDDEEDSLSYLHENVYSVEPRPHNDFYEIAYPAKFKSIVNDGWKVLEIKRSGFFARNSLLADNSILDELSGSDGATHQTFKRDIKVSNRAHMSSAKEDIKTCLRDNPVWKAHILRHLEEIEAEFPNAEIKASIFNPCAGLFTLYFFTTREDGVFFVPQYSLTILEPEPKRMYYGYLSEDMVPKKFNEIVGKYYNGDIGELMRAMSWGGYETRDTEILEDAGLAYRSFRCEINGQERKFFSWEKERWKVLVEGDLPFAALGRFVQNNGRFIKNLTTKIGLRDFGGIFDWSSPEKMFAEKVDIQLTRQEIKILKITDEVCASCESYIEDEKYVIKGKMQGDNADLLMCGDCSAVLERGIGPELGDLYTKVDGAWTCVGKVSPEN